jgi:hydrogenase 3 maturation protease
MEALDAMNGRKKPVSPEKSHMNHPGQLTTKVSLWPQELAKLLAAGYVTGPVVIVGLGHPLRSDDYVGSLIAKDLAKKTKDHGRVKVVDAENSPENVYHMVLRNEPGLIMFIDSVDVGLEPGSIILADLNETSYPFFTTHNLPLKMLMQSGPEAPRVVLLGIQPRTLEVGGPVSEEVEQARSIVIQELVRIVEELR